MEKIILIFSYICFNVICTSAQSASFQFESKSQFVKHIVDPEVQRFNELQPGYYKLTSEQKEFYYYTNYSRVNPRRFWDSIVQGIVDDFPDFRSGYSESLKKDLYLISTLPLFDLNDSLVEMATWLANDNMQSGNPSHTSSDGQDFSSRFKKSGVTSFCGGENLAWGSLTPLFALISLYIDRGLPQLGHRKALLNPLYTQIGIAVVHGKKDDNFYVQDFACKGR